MSRRLLAFNVVLGIVSVALLAGTVRTLIVRRPLPAPAATRAMTAPAPTAPATTGDAGLSSYAVIASRNLFNPARSETAVAVAPMSKPILHGVVIDGPKSRAFLEDPVAKRVIGYSVGDVIGGGKIQRITDDKVVILRPEGPLEVLLQDPSKPRPSPTAAAPTPGSPATPPGSVAPQTPPTVQVPTSPQSPIIGPPPTGPESPLLRRRSRGQGND